LKYYVAITFGNTLPTLNAFRGFPYFLKTNAETVRITIAKFLSFALVSHNQLFRRILKARE